MTEISYVASENAPSHQIWSQYLIPEQVMNIYVLYDKHWWPYWTGMLHIFQNGWSTYVGSENVTTHQIWSQHVIPNSKRMDAGKGMTIAHLSWSSKLSKLNVWKHLFGNSGNLLIKSLKPKTKFQDFYKVCSYIYAKKLPEGLLQKNPWGILCKSLSKNKSKHICSFYTLLWQPIMISNTCQQIILYTKWNKYICTSCTSSHRLHLAYQKPESKHYQKLCVQQQLVTSLQLQIHLQEGLRRLGPGPLAWGAGRRGGSIGWCLRRGGRHARLDEWCCGLSFQLMQALVHSVHQAVVLVVEVAVDLCHLTLRHGGCHECLMSSTLQMGCLHAVEVA